METNELLLLGLLDREAMHGYRLHEFLEHRLGVVTDLKRPTAYRLLERLHERGLVRRASERAGRRPERMVYQLTPAGRERFSALLRAHLAQASPFRSDGDVPLLFLDRVPPAERRDLMRRRRATVAAHRAMLVELVAAHPAGSMGRLVLEHHLAHADAELAWHDRLLETLADAPTPEPERP